LGFELNDLKDLQKLSANPGRSALHDLGVTLAATSYLINAANGFHGKSKGENLFMAGVTAAAVSPPFFIIAGMNKRKAKLVLKSEQVTSAIMFSNVHYRYFDKV
jgi:hypothetical protein